MIFNIKVNENKTIEADEITINYSENEFDSFLFAFFDDGMSYVAELKTPLKKKLTLPINANTLLITNTITAIPGKWELLVVGVKGETVFVSNSISFNVGDNYLDYKEMEEMDANLEILYAEMLEKMAVLETLDLDGLESMNTDIQEIKSTVASISRMSSQILEVVQYNKTTLNSINNNVNSVGNLVGIVNTKTDTTKTNTDTIISLLTDATTTVNEIL